MAASTAALNPTHSRPFNPNNLNTHKTTATRSLSPFGTPANRRSPSPRSPKSAMTPRVSPQPPRSDETADGKPSKPSVVYAVERAAAAGKEAASQMSQPMAAIAKSIQVPENAPSTAGAQVSPISATSHGSAEGSAATTATAPAVATPAASSDNAIGLSGPDSGRPVVDPGLPGVSDSTPNRAFTYPAPLPDDLHTPNQRNLSLPNNVYSGGSPRSGSGSKRHKCPYCSTEFTRHHNLKSHLLTHSQEKPYECQQCQSRFRRLHDLKRHTKLHTGERPHMCPNCGRKFARGDALARHSKGPGGCAGRRPSFIEEDPSGNHRMDDSMDMDGIEYTAEPDNMDEDEGSPEPRANTDSSKHRTTTSDGYRPNTYPGVGQQSLPSVFTPAPPRSRDPSIGSQGPLSSLQHFNAAQPVFPQSGMTESPKPISPGQPGERSLPPRHTGQYSSGRGASPTSLPPPPIGALQLPGLQNLPPPPPPGTGSHPGSLGSSSRHSGSGNSMRDILGPSHDVLHMYKELEKKFNDSRAEHNAIVNQLRNDCSRIEGEHRAEINTLKSEVERLKSQLNERARP
ncbi:hypothetical protein BT63DRAFT_213553 [Microthyrium microscopicum]|uniref:C2H2-type domain-containing protein n=1 Tax=Microthyrium microscopicum TaxID=703497 RepID=A0A6A6UJR3_9PEZI|nr:hypothetical protein BT63DRAFT_213553 [Microthyrium microscopicum]